MEKIESLIINIINVEDTLKLGGNEVVAEMIEIAKTVVKKGGKLIIHGECEDDAPEILVEFTTVEELENWKNILNAAQAKLDRDPII